MTMPGKTYMRPMANWWLRNGYYRWYMLRETTSVVVAAYAVVLLVGLLRLAQGPAAYDAWRAWLATPWAIFFHVVTVLLFLYHAWTWFEIMPKTLPFLRIGGRRVADRAIVGAGAGAAIVASLALFAAARWLT